MKLILYARKSSESEDRQVQSIDDQVRILEELATRNQWLIVERISESKSAKSPDERDGFNHMLKQIEKGRAEGVLCWSLNRLTRNPVDSGKLQWMLQQKVLKAIYTPDKNYLPEDNVLLFKVETGVSEQFILDLVKVTQRGVQSKVEKGWYPGLAPEGYLNHEREIIRDPSRFELVQWAFQRMGTGLISMRELVDEVNTRGYQTRTTKRRAGTLMTDTSLGRILRNPFYAGWFMWGKELHEGNHEAMVAWDTFVDVQKALDAKGRPKERKHEFVFKGNFTCGVCGRTITAEKQKGHVYYRCANQRKCKQGSIREEKVQEAIGGVVESLTYPENYLIEIKRIVGEWYEQDAGFSLGIVEAQNRQLEELHKRLNVILGLLTKGILDEEDFTREHRDIKQKLSGLKIEQHKTIQSLERARETTIRTCEIARDAHRIINHGGSEEKRALLAEIEMVLVLKDGEIMCSVNPLFEPFIFGYESAKTPPNEEGVSAWGTKRVNVRTIAQVWELAKSGLRLRSAR